jgi:thiol:disulfide interchange protein DsbG
VSVAANSHTHSVAGKMLDQIHHATWISEGNSPHVIYVIFDPNCPYCHRIYEETRDAVRQNTIQIRWIPVGILATTSYGKAISILDADDPLKAFYINENQYSISDGGGIDEALDGSDKTTAALKNNAALLRLTGFDPVPSILFRARDDRPILIKGAPPKGNLKELLPYVK